MNDPLPPNQVATTRFPRIGEREPEPFDAATWRLDITGLVNHPLSLTFDDLAALPHVERAGTIHCVTRWSRPGTAFRGVALAEILRHAGPTSAGRFVRFVSGRGHDTSLPIAVALADVLVADAVSLGGGTAADGAFTPIAPENGGPVRTMVFTRYIYKTVKWVRRVEVVAEDRLGFWERTAGYHNGADPWKEERYIASTVDGPTLKRRLAARDLSGMDLRSADLGGMDLAGVNLRGASLRNARLPRADLRGADLTHANLTNADLSAADLRDATIDGIDFDGADLRRADFRGSRGVPSSLACAQFQSTETDGAEVSGVVWTAARLDGLLPDQETWLRARGVVGDNPHELTSA
ncbi:MAG: pentapeptide repeat-containing protein [Planctomycetes bacterium]|nr:pentapeptide repeat-containing protein [Planctomycetota bacterium]